MKRSLFLGVVLCLSKVANAGALYITSYQPVGSAGPGLVSSVPMGLYCTGNGEMEDNCEGYSSQNYAQVKTTPTPGSTFLGFFKLAVDKYGRATFRNVYNNPDYIHCGPNSWRNLNNCVFNPFQNDPVVRLDENTWTIPIWIKNTQKVKVNVYGGYTVVSCVADGGFAIPNAVYLPPTPVQGYREFDVPTGCHLIVGTSLGHRLSYNGPGLSYTRTSSSTGYPVETEVVNYSVEGTQEIIAR